jgi:hypothetical protein
MREKHVKNGVYLKKTAPSQQFPELMMDSSQSGNRTPPAWDLPVFIR